MIDRPEGGERAVLIHVNFPAGSMQQDLAEFKELVRSAGAESLATCITTRSTPDPKYFIGSGKVEEIVATVKQTNAELVILNHALTPAQERNLEKQFSCRVIDRTGLILDIFAQRARSFEGKLQIELALLRHMSTRLVRGWTHLERQRGGIGLRGPGETQLETDRRLLRKRIKTITERLIKVRLQRQQSRQARDKGAIPTVALVGYTNAGKSTLFNKLTTAEVYAADLLFATLDPTLRRMVLPSFGPIILADTVGFIRHLPHDLIDAFRATLEEVTTADVLLHVVDMHDPRLTDNIREVNDVLGAIGAELVPQVLVYNKVDLCDDHTVLTEPLHNPPRVWISAQKNQGLHELNSVLAPLLAQSMTQTELTLSAFDAKVRAELYALGAVLTEKITANGDWQLSIRLSGSELKRLLAQIKNP